MPDRTTLRALRVTVFSAVCVLLGILGHGWESGRHPTAAPVVLGSGLAVFVASRLAGRERSLAALTTAVLAVQAVLHVVFSLCSGGQAAPAAGGYGGFGVHTEHGRHLAPAGAAGAGTAADLHLGMSAGMVVMHVLAGLAAAWWLRRGEAAAWSWYRWLAVRAGRTLRLLLAPAVAGPAHEQARRPAASRAPCGLTRHLLRDTLVRRGPPLPVWS
jgi:hypothetical protein